MTLKQKRILSIAALMLFVIGMVVIFIFIGKPLIRLVTDADAFRQWVEDRGVWAPLAFVVMITLQVIVAIIPGEPFELCAGYAFGTVEGTLYCLLGSLIGGAVVFMLVRKWGTKMVELFFSLDKINSMKFLNDSRKRNTITFILMMVPGTPKDLITYLAGLTKITLPQWLIISTVARIPSVASSVIGGSLLAEKEYLSAGIVLVATMAVSILGLVIYNIIVKKHQEKKAL